MIPVTIHFWSWTTPMDELETAQIQYPISFYYQNDVVLNLYVVPSLSLSLHTQPPSLLGVSIRVSVSDSCRVEVGVFN